MGKVSNCITMASLLAKGRKYSIEELSNLIEVTPRMIRVYKEELEKSGIYIDTIRGRYGGYVLNQSLKLPSREFKCSDIKLLEELEVNIKNPETKNQLIVLKDKVHSIYLENKKEKLELTLKDETLLKYNLLNRAIKEKRKVEILYYSLTKGETKRIIHPLEIFLYANGWGIAAFCENKKDLRHFELERIIDYKLLDEEF